MTTAKAEAAQSFADWFKKYDSLNDLHEGEGFKNFVLCAAKSLSAQSEDGAFSEDDIIKLIEALQDALTTEALISLVRKGKIVPGLIDGVLAFGPID